MALLPGLRPAEGWMRVVHKREAWKCRLKTPSQRAAGANRFRFPTVDQTSCKRKMTCRVRGFTFRGGGQPVGDDRSAGDLQPSAMHDKRFLGVRLLGCAYSIAITVYFASLRRAHTPPAVAPIATNLVPGHLGT